jgi:hypothetical protein
MSKQLEVNRNVGNIQRNKTALMYGQQKIAKCNTGATSVVGHEHSGYRTQKFLRNSSTHLLGCTVSSPTIKIFPAWKTPDFPHRLYTYAVVRQAVCLTPKYDHLT